MVQSDRGKTFEKHEPQLTDEEILNAYETGSNLLSFASRVAPIEENVEYLALKLALADGTQPTILLDEFAGRALWQLLQTVAGEMNWNVPKVGGGVH